MEWINIKLNIPDEIKKLYEKISNIQRNSCIAGGFLSDLYMGTPFKDVDIFIKDNDSKEMDIQLLMQGLGYEKLPDKNEFNEEYDFSFRVETFSNKKYTVQLIFTDMGIKHVKYFDFRFREFFYLKGKVYASKEAMEDIKEKKLAFGSYKSSIKALSRFFKFQSKYGFSFDRKSLDFFNASFNSKHISKIHLLEKIKTMETPIKNKFLKIIEKYENKGFIELPTTFNESIITSYIFYNMQQCPLEREEMENIMNLNNDCVDSFTMDDEIIFSIKNDYEKLIEPTILEIKKQRVRFLTNGKVYEYNQLLSILENRNSDIEENDIYKLFHSFSFKDKYVTKIKNDFYTIVPYLAGYNCLIKNRTVNIYKNYRFLRGEGSIKELAKGNLRLFEIGSVGWLSYHIRKKEVVDQSGNYHLLARSTQFVDSIINKFEKKSLLV